jgi:hypothetical protein
MPTAAATHPTAAATRILGHAFLLAIPATVPAAVAHDVADAVTIAVLEVRAILA